jgi:ParB-like chromosome segregation protein Spo0J
MNTLKNISKDKPESIMISASDEVNTINLGIALPGHTIEELEELKKSIEEIGVEVPILAKEKSDTDNSYVIVESQIIN